MLRRGVVIALISSFCLECGCGGSGSPENPPPRDTVLLVGPLVRVEIARGAELFVWTEGTVEIAGREPGAENASVLRVPSPCALGATTDGIELNGRLVLASLTASAGRGYSPGVPTGAGKGFPEVRDGTGGTALAASRDGPGESTGAFVGLSSDAEPETVSWYRGVLEMETRGDSIRVVNVLPLEGYLAGVVGAEMPALYPLEALKAQAVASRAYTFHALQAAVGRGRVAVFRAGTSFQVYRGRAAEHPRVLRALDETAGEILTYAGQVFPAYFHSTCGGQTAQGSVVFGERPIVPLEGARCGACDTAPYARWEVTIAREELEDVIRRRVRAAASTIRMGQLLSISVAETSPDGRALYLEVEHQWGSFQWRADRFRREVEAAGPGRIRSTAFTVESQRDGEAFRFRGAGWGHGVGLCQVGAGRMGRDASYRDILARYYPHSEIARAYRSRESGS